MLFMILHKIWKFDSHFAVKTELSSSKRTCLVYERVLISNIY